MAAARPAVVTAAGGMPEVVVEGNTGYVVPPRDPEALAARLVELLRDEGLRARMGAAGLARARAKFSVETMVAGTAAVYDDLAASRL
jgi:glycosyltransferase involved in cell wall biosynthesis